MTDKSEKIRSSMDEYLMRTLKRIIKYHEDKELELLLKPLIKKWGKKFINERYNDGIKYYIELSDKLGTRGLVKMNTSDSALSNFYNRVVSIEDIKNIGNYTSVSLGGHKAEDVHIEREERKSRKDVVSVKLKSEDDESVTHSVLNINTLNDKCVEALKEAKEVHKSGKNIEKCLKKLEGLKILINQTLLSSSKIEDTKVKWFESVLDKIEQIIILFKVKIGEQQAEEEPDDSSSDSDDELNEITPNADNEEVITIHHVTHTPKVQPDEEVDEEEESESEKEEEEEEVKEERTTDEILDEKIFTVKEPVEDEKEECIIRLF